MGDSTATLGIIIKARDMASGQVNKLNGSLKGLASGGLSGLGLGFMGAAGAAAMLTGALVKGVQGAIDEEASIKKMTAALKANVTNWDGNTDAIDAAIKARENLGFSDDDLRASMTKLIPATKNVTGALELQRTAMDLARLKGIDLESASQALVKVEAGQYRALKDLGIVLRDGATQTEALAAVQAVAEGQAASYADTTAGKMDTLGIKFDDLTEKVGAALVPALDGLVTNLTKVMDAIDLDKPQTFMDRIDGLADAFYHLNPMTAAQASAQDTLNAKMQAAYKPTYDAALAMDTYAEKTAEAREPTKRLTSSNNGLADSFGRVAQTGAEALAAVQAEIDALYELDWINRHLHPRGSGNSGALSHSPTGVATPHASGGWAGLNGPELSLLGEKGPEYVIPNHQLGKSGSPEYVAVGVSRKDIARMVDQELYFRLQLTPRG